MTDRAVSRPASLGILIACALASPVAWLTFLGVGDQLDETLCATGASHRGRWFGIDVRVVIAVLGAATLIVTAVCVAYTVREWRRLRDAGTLARTRATIALWGALAGALMVPIVVATLVFLTVASSCT